MKIECWEDRTNSTLTRIVEQLQEAAKDDQTFRNRIQRVKIDAVAVKRWVKELMGILAAPNAPENNHLKLRATGKD
ncbi:hypothetical protein GJ744_006431 [Endocarpon pusillum]|uniref:Uncharacterized protein n=1 Tax=Endocarpon pusillum TaxID=364733 RepID=A0A8H7A457_9EURO|nr:hypothetical protein GJ744_006431 [Endocarpon pusillum]